MKEEGWGYEPSQLQRENLVPLALVPQQYTPTKYIHFISVHTDDCTHYRSFMVWEDERRVGCKSFQMKNFLKRDANLEWDLINLHNVYIPHLLYKVKGQTSHQSAKIYHSSLICKTHTEHKVQQSSLKTDGGLYICNVNNIKCIQAELTLLRFCFRLGESSNCRWKI